MGSKWQKDAKRAEEVDAHSNEWIIDRIKKFSDVKLAVVHSEICDAVCEAMKSAELPPDPVVQLYVTAQAVASLELQMVVRHMITAGVDPNSSEVDTITVTCSALFDAMLEAGRETHKDDDAARKLARSAMEDKTIQSAMKFLKHYSTLGRS